MIKGLGEFLAAMDKDIEMVERETKRAVKSTGESMDRDANHLAAVDTGIMKASIELEITDSGMTAEVSAEAFNPRNGFNYAYANELLPNNPAYSPFLQPALDKNVGELEKGLEKVANKIGGG